VEIPLVRGGSRKCVTLARVEPVPGADSGLRCAVWPRPSRVGAQAPRFAIAPETGFDRLREVAAIPGGDPAAAAPSPRAVPVASLVAASAALETDEASPILPQFAVTASEDLDGLREWAALRASGLGGAAPSLRPAPAACMGVPSAALDGASAVWPAALPSFQCLTSIASLARRPRPAALVETGGHRQHPGGAVQSPFHQRERLPRFSVTACFEAGEPPVGSNPRPFASEDWMAPGSPALTARMALPSIAGAMPHRVPAPSMPGPTQSYPAAVEPQLSPCALFQPAPRPQAVLVDASPSMIAVSALAPAVRLPVMPAWQAGDSQRGAHVGRAGAPAAQPVESWPAVGPFSPAPVLGLLPLAIPVPAFAAVSGRTRLDCVAKPDPRLLPAPLAPAAARMAASTTAGAHFKPRVRVGKPFTPEQVRKPAILRPASFAALDFHCRPTPGVVTGQVAWLAPVIALIRPRQAVRPIFDRWEDVAPAPGTKGGFKKVAVMPRTMRQLADSKHTRHAIGAIAAGLFLGAVIWYSLGSGSGRNPRAMGPEVAVDEAPAAAAAAALRRQPTGTVARLRHAVAERAAVSWSDSFRSGMGAWGAGAKSWAPGWTPSADGYVQPGSLAVFRPTLNYTDYTLEFFGQIERQSIDWVVRARDDKNYYAMKVAVVRAGMRPTVALAHYSVVNGRKAGYMETPLDIMVHNSRPMQVLVDVQGNHFTASVDGQQVGSWTDSAPATGGVGFFSETGEKARLYWMRVSRNQDFLGRLCAYIAGSPAAQTAGLWYGDPCRRPHQDAPDVPADPAEALGLAAVVALRRSRVRSRAFHAASNFAERRI
jgi:hypothetical protein